MESTALSLFGFDQVCYLTLCEKGFPKRLAFLYLDEIHNEFVVSEQENTGQASFPPPTAPRWLLPSGNLSALVYCCPSLFPLAYLICLQAFLEEAEAKKATDEKRTPQDWVRQVKASLSAKGGKPRARLRALTAALRMRESGFRRSAAPLGFSR
jgi:hypothetical protein